jgi:hypothetical protein
MNGLALAGPMARGIIAHLAGRVSICEDRHRMELKSA